MYFVYRVFGLYNNISRSSKYSFLHRPVNGYRFLKNIGVVCSLPSKVQTWGQTLIFAFPNKVFKVKKKMKTRSVVSVPICRGGTLVCRIISTMTRRLFRWLYIACKYLLIVRRVSLYRQSVSKYYYYCKTISIRFRCVPFHAAVAATAD